MRRAERGEYVEPDYVVNFVTWQALANVMSDKRHQLLRHLRAKPEKSVRALARALKRDYKRVYEDVKALKAARLIEVKRGLLRADYDEIRTAIKVNRAA
jgi:predicted transcriptional regulator